MDFRTRDQRVPRDLFPTGELRIHLGTAARPAETREFEHRREILQKLARRGQWDILAGIKAGRLTVEEVVRLVDEKGLDNLHLEIRSPGLAPPIGEAVAAWLETIEQARTRATYESHIRHVLEYVGADTPVTAVGSHHVNDLLTDLKTRGFAANTRQSVWTAGSAFFTWFMARDESIAETTGRAPLLRIHPFRRANKVQTPTTRHRFLTQDEFQRLLEVAPPSLRAQYSSLVYTGLRMGEFVNLPPEHVMLPSHLAVKPFGSWAPKGYPRYDHGVRNVPIHRVHLLPLLEEYLEKWAGDVSFFVNPRTVERWTHQGFIMQLKRDVTAAGLTYGARKDGKPIPDGITAHTFRHTLGSWLAARDVQLKKIALILGDTVPTVDRFYSHLLPQDLDETINEAL